MISVKDIPDSIQWHEGMLLQPQHFQQLNYRAEDLAFYYSRLFIPYLWGVVKMEIDELKIAQGIFNITRLEAVMPDGLLVYHDEVELGRKLEANIQDKFGDGLELTLHLAVPAFQFNPQQDRFHSDERVVLDDAMRKKRINVSVLRPKLYLLSDEQINKSYTSFPIAKISFRESAYQITSFLPPVLSLGRGSEVYSRCASLLSDIRQKTQKLDDELASMSSSASANDFLGLQYKIERLVSELPSLEGMLNSNITHPYLVYLGLCSLAGKVCSLNYNKVPPSFSPYDHNNIAQVFFELIHYIKLSISQIIEKYQIVILRQKDGRFIVPVKHLPHPGEPLIIGIYTTGIERDELERWMKIAFIATEDHIDRAISNRVYGADRNRIDYYEPLNIIPVANLLLFAIDVSGEYVSSNQPLIIQSSLEPDYIHTPKELGLYVSK